MWRRREKPIRALFACVVGGLVAWLLGASWMRWADPVIDFGREVYLPWRVLQGEHLGREFVHPYGPLSVYLNAGLFGAFGISVRTLVLANLVIFGGIVVCLHTVLRRSFGFLPAAVATLVGVAVFGFAHYWGINNYTYAAPYSHEATHGMLLLLLLLVWLGRPQNAGARQRDGLITGVLIGLCCLTKTEYVFVSLLLGVFALLRIWVDEAHRTRLLAWAAGSLMGLISVFVLAWAALACALPPVAAGSLVFNAILAPVVYADYSHSVHVLHFLGADNLWKNLRIVLLWGGGTLGCLAAVTLGGQLVASTSRRVPGYLFIALILAGVGAAVPRIPWVFCGTVFPLLLAAATMAIAAHQFTKAKPWWCLSCRRWNQLLYLSAAVGMLGRMAFDPTISHYGFFQALLAGTWLCGYLVGVWPSMAAPSSRLVRSGLMLAVIALLGGGTVSLVRTSLKFYRLKELSIGEGADRIRGYVPQVYALPQLWEQARTYIATHSSPGSSLLVIPEGISLNYWTRRRHPLRLADLLPATLRLNRGAVVAELAANPPEMVVLASRPNMEELGFKTYGQDEASGQAILDWVSHNYTLVAQAGGDPLAPGAVGLQILKLKRP